MPELRISDEFGGFPNTIRMGLYKIKMVVLSGWSVCKRFESESLGKATSAQTGFRSDSGGKFVTRS